MFTETFLEMFREHVICTGNHAKLTVKHFFSSIIIDKVDTDRKHFFSFLKNSGSRVKTVEEHCDTE